MHLIAQAIQGRALQAGPAIAIVAENVVAGQHPALLVDMLLEAAELLLNGLIVDLIEGRHADIDCYTHWVPPGRWSLMPLDSLSAPGLGRQSIAEGIGTPDPSAAER